MPQKDATVQLQDAAAIVDQWHAAYMEVMTPNRHTRRFASRMSWFLLLSVPSLLTELRALVAVAGERKDRDGWKRASLGIQ